MYRIRFHGRGGQGMKTVFVNAAGCMTLLSVYPFTPFRGSWLYTAMASAPAGAQGVRDALDILLQQKRIEQDEDLEVVHTRFRGKGRQWKSASSCRGALPTFSNQSATKPCWPRSSKRWMPTGRRCRFRKSRLFKGFTPPMTDTLQNSNEPHSNT